MAFTNGRGGYNTDMAFHFNDNSCRQLKQLFYVFYMFYSFSKFLLLLSLSGTLQKNKKHILILRDSFCVENLEGGEGAVECGRARSRDDQIKFVHVLFLQLLSVSYTLSKICLQGGVKSPTAMATVLKIEKFCNVM